jgi:glutamate dehydrogenase (NAD(P)+)
MSTDERDMDVIFSRTGRSIGRTGGIELDKLGLTALGVMHAFRVLVDGGFVDGIDHVDGTTLAIEGFGNVGAAFARFAAQAGVGVVAVSDFVNPELDYGGVVHHPDGLDLDRLVALREEGRSVVETDQPGVRVFRGRAELKRVFAVPADVTVPAARTNSIDVETARGMRTKLVLEAANGPLTDAAERHLHERGIVCGVDYIVNCGGVIGGAEGWAELRSPLGALRVPSCVARIVAAVGTNIPAVYELARARGVTPREAAAEIVRPRIAQPA